MTGVTLTVNGRAVTAEVEPRTHLADFLREQLLLTGTHLGCEHGVCGACTVLLDGEPARSCIAYAAACDGADIRTIEGLEDDPVTIARCARPSPPSTRCNAATARRACWSPRATSCMRLPDADDDAHPPGTRRQSVPLHRL